MCFNTIASYIQASAAQKSANEASVQQYKYEQQQQRLVNQAVSAQFAEQLARNQVDTARQAQQALETSQQNILQIHRQQAAAIANAGSAGITGSPLQMLFNDYQTSIGGVASNLQTTYTQLNQNLFLNAYDARLQGQAKINQAIPAKPYMAPKPPAAAYWFAGAGEAASDVAQAFGVPVSAGGNPGNYSPGAGAPRGSTQWQAANGISSEAYTQQELGF